MITMAHRSPDGTLLGYSAPIAAAIGNDDDALLDLVEEFMRGHTGGSLDAVSAATFDLLARQAMSDIIAWSIVGAVDEITLVRYCEILGLTYPTCLDEHGTIVAVEI
jgi:hypothetical protein